MSTEALDRARSHKTASPEDRDERARAAVKVFRSLQFSLTGFARALTGNKKVRVEVSSLPPHTDGTVIYYRPPIELGNKVPHDRSNCDKRHSTTGILICSACALREQVMVNILHEIAHIAYGSFAETNSNAKKNALTHAINEWGGKYAEPLKRRFESAPEFTTSTYLGLSQLISPFLPHLINCLEDARVDSLMFEARKGTRKMLGVDTLSLMREGVPNADGELDRWYNAPLNSQAALGCYLYGARHEGWEEFFAPEVTALFTDTQLRGLLDGVTNCRTVADIYNLAFPVLARLRELGFMLLPEETPEETEEGNEDQEEEGASSDREDSSGQDESDDHGDSDQQSSGDSDDSDDREPDQDGEDSPEGHTESGYESGEGNEPEEGGVGSGTDSESPDYGKESDVGLEGGVADEADEAADGANEGGEEAGGDPVSDPGPGAGSDGRPDDGSVPERGSKDGRGLDDGSDSDEVSERNGEPADRIRSPEGGVGIGGSDQPESTTEGESSDSSGGSDQQAGSESSDGSPDSSEVEGSESASNGSSEPASGEAGGNDGLGGSASEVPAGSRDAFNEDADSVADSTAESDSEGDRPETESTGEGPELDDILESGADEGLGGIKIEEVTPREYGDPGIVEQNLAAVHDRQLEEAKEASTPPTKDGTESAADHKAIAVAILQGQYFETPSTVVVEVNIFKRGDGPGHLSQRSRLNQEEQKFFGIDHEVTESVSEKVFGPNLLQLRRIFSDNQTSGLERNRRSGRINKQVLGRRAWNDDDRLFAKRRLPAKKDYAVLIGIDISSSTLGDNLILAKDAAYIQAELCARLGIKFAVFAHSANVANGGLSMDIHLVKDWDEPWNPDAIESLSKLAGNGGNLDGHTLEYYRKQLDRRTETDRVILYYTDGKMPAANHDEELEILQREIKICKRQNYTLMGVGIRTESPRRHGLDTVTVESSEDFKAVINHLGKRLQK